VQAHASDNPLQGRRNQKMQVTLEASRAGVRGGGTHVEVGLTKGHRLSFE
jgi:hypothetical protein